MQKIISLASPATPAHVPHHFGSAMEVLKRGEGAEIIVAGKAYPVKPAFVEDVESYDMARQMMECEIPIMAVRAGDDELVGPQAAEQILEYTSAESQLRQIDGADHIFSERTHAAELLDIVQDWIG